MSEEPELIFCGVRGGDFGMVDDDWQLECRFVDGQKYAAVHVALDFEQLALDIAAWLNERALQRGHGHPEDKTRAARYQALEVLGDALRDWRIHAIAEQHANAVAFSLADCLAEMVKALVKEKKFAVENKGLF
mgnify:CR=1 FL=1